MIFLIESVVACLIFTLLIKLISHNRQEVFTNDYPPVVTDKLRTMGLIAEKPPAKKKDMIRKLTDHSWMLSNSIKKTALCFLLPVCSTTSKPKT